MAGETGLYLGVDTSCYTTSAALASSEGIVRNIRTMLRVRLGDAGLRQSEAVFQHVENLGDLMERLLADVDAANIAAIGVSASPRDTEGSYMPVFRAGTSLAQALAAALHVPLYRFSHQAGHIRAALFGNEALLSGEFLALHLSGGTTEVTKVWVQNSCVGRIALLGGTTDLHAGQFVDRVGVALGLPFPAGPAMEELARAHMLGFEEKLPSRVDGLVCSFSGVETAAQRLIQDGASKEAVAYAVYDCLARTVAKLLENAAQATGIADALLCGGVASSLLLRTLLQERTAHSGLHLHYGEPALSGDNAAGAALLARDRHLTENI